MARLVGLMTAFVLTFASSSAQADTKILLVGNSFTVGVQPKLLALIRSAGHSATVVTRASNNWTLADHLSSRATIKRIDSKPWDYVVLQEQSLGLFHARYPTARALDAEIHGQGSQTVFFMTWRDLGAPLISYDSLHGKPSDDVGYVPIAFELGDPIAPVGWVFRAAVLEDPAIKLWASDGHHASDRGRYIAALTLFTTIFHQSPVGLWRPPTMTEADALHDQMLVEQVTLGNPSEWNLQ